VETVMPTAADVTALALMALLEELGELRADQIDRIDPLDSEASARVAAAMSEAMAALEAADRLDLLEAAAQRLALACMHREIPQPARAAAYAALVGLIASDMLPPATFRALNQAWEALAGSTQSSAILRGEEILLHIE
jgi:PAS domain-containing protein